MKQVYLPVAVTVDTRTGELVEAEVDFHGAPWMFVNTDANVWAVVDDDYDWTHDEEAEALAIAVLTGRLG